MLVPLAIALSGGCGRYFTNYPHRTLRPSDAPARVVESGEVRNLTGLDASFGLLMAYDAFLIEVDDPDALGGRDRGDRAGRRRAAYEAGTRVDRRFLARVIGRTPDHRRSSWLTDVAERRPDVGPDLHRVIVGTRPVAVALVPPRPDIPGDGWWADPRFAWGDYLDREAVGLIVFVPHEEHDPADDADAPVTVARFRRPMPVAQAVRLLARGALAAEPAVASVRVD